MENVGQKQNPKARYGRRLKTHPQSLQRTACTITLHVVTLFQGRPKGLSSHLMEKGKNHTPPTTLCCGDVTVYPRRTITGKRIDFERGRSPSNEGSRHLACRSFLGLASALIVVTWDIRSTLITSFTIEQEECMQESRPFRINRFKILSC